MTHSHSKKGFTLIELLVVIAIIGILSSVVLAALTAARNKANDSKRMTDINAIQTALEMYASGNNAYPTTGGNWNSQCNDYGGGQTANEVIPGLVPTYLPKMPSDPQMNAYGGTCCYRYQSNGTDYKFIIHNCSFSYACYGDTEASRGFSDPTRPTSACAAYTIGATNW